GEAVSAVVVGGWRIGETAVAVPGQVTVSGLSDQYRAQAVAIDVAVVGEHAGRCHIQGGVLGHGVGIVQRHARVVHASDGEADRGNSGVGLAVIHLVSEPVRAAVV